MIKKFFWSTALSGLFLIVAQFTPLRDKVNETLAVALKQAGVKVPRPADPNVMEIVSRPVPGPASTGTTTAGAAAGAAAGSAATLETEVLRYQGEDYVQINGKYYKYRTDNIYEVDGRKVLFMKNRLAAPADRGVAAAGSGGGGDLQIPVTPSQMFETLKSAKNAMDRREKEAREVGR
jgi:hypothetical protein